MNLTEYNKLKNDLESLKSKFEDVPQEIKDTFENYINTGPNIPETVEEVRTVWENISSGEYTPTVKKDCYVPNDKVEFAHEEGPTLNFPKFSIEHLETEGGYEGGGEDFSCVFKIVVDGKDYSFWKWTGYYASYDGAYLTNLYRVEPKEITKTVYNII